MSVCCAGLHKFVVLVDFKRSVSSLRYFGYIIFSKGLYFSKTKPLKTSKSKQGQ